MSATCPACGVPVVPGYVRCPKCQRPLPGARKGIQTVAGGTAVEGGGGLPLLPIAAGAVVVLCVILYFVLGNSNAAKPASPVADTPATEEPAGDPGDPSSPNTPTPLTVEPDRTTGAGGGDPNRIDASAVAADLARALKNQRLWSKVQVVGKDVEVTSGSCRDGSMLPTVAAASTALRNAGLTRVRCLENSGAVVFERAL